MSKYPLVCIWIFLFFISCSSTIEKDAENKINSENSTIQRLQGKWQEEKDSMHQIEFSENRMIEFYNHSEINKYEVKIFEGMPGKGGFEDASGMIIQIEESKDNFHHFIIEVLNSNNLELFHRGAGQRKNYNRLKN